MSSPLSGVEPGGAFFLYGDDEFRKEEAARALVDLHIDPSTRDFNLDRIRGGDVDLETLASILATPPMMAEWRVVLLSEAEAMAQSSRARTIVLDAVTSPPPGLAFILVASIPGGSKARFYTDLKKEARSMEFEEIAENDVPGWIMTRALERHGLEMDEDAARALGGGIGTDLGILAQEVDKLAGMVDEGARITIDDVKEAGTLLPSVDRWSWMDQVGERRFDEALADLPVLLMQKGETGVGLVIGLARHLIRLGVAAEGGREAVSEILPGHLRRWLPGKLAGQARRWSVEELERSVSGLRRADQLMKSTSLDHGAIIEEWLLERMVGAGDGEVAA